jgi:hypothetical protein
MLCRLDEFSHESSPTIEIPGSLDANHMDCEQIQTELTPPLVPSHSSTSAFWPSEIWALGGPRSQLIYNSMELILRVLRSWPGMLAEGFQLPPLFHHSQFSAWADGPTDETPELANCITIAKMWHGQKAGAEILVQDTVIREADMLLSQFPAASEGAQLRSLQALVIYAVLILSPSKRSHFLQSVDKAFFARIRRTVQLVVGMNDLYLQAEKDSDCRLHWKDWIQVTARRRAVLALYLLQWAYSMYHGVQSFDCHELNFMPAPAAKVLWQARTEREWNILYERWLQRWKGEAFLQGEFMTVSKGIVLDERADRWLQEADEFGLILISIGMCYIVATTLMLAYTQSRQLMRRITQTTLHYSVCQKILSVQLSIDASDYFHLGSKNVQHSSLPASHLRRSLAWKGCFHISSGSLT